MFYKKGVSLFKEHSTKQLNKEAFLACDLIVKLDIEA